MEFPRCRFLPNYCGPHYICLMWFPACENVYEDTLERSRTLLVIFSSVYEYEARRNVPELRSWKRLRSLYVFKISAWHFYTQFRHFKQRPGIWSRFYLSEKASTTLSDPIWSSPTGRDSICCYDEQKTLPKQQALPQPSESTRQIDISQIGAWPYTFYLELPWAWWHVSMFIARDITLP